ncbi:YueH family protein [Metabacillus sp. 84]|uniref:YueH family protein n=1 Tax=unclassified Metabacillus TaxID=2675274 RepID=UPI003CE852EE
MNTALEKMVLSGNRVAEVFLHQTATGQYVAAVPDIHWSAKFNQIDDLHEQFVHLQSSLNFHMFEGNTDELAKAIIGMVKKFNTMNEVL